MYASNAISSSQSLYSYDQYHWWPITLIFIEGVPTSSRRYNKRNLGNPIANSTKQGNVVHSISVDWDSNREVFIILLVRIRVKRNNKIAAAIVTTVTITQS
jgi:hypothetical protein